MFERYTEKARRAIFFARAESSKLGGPFIESEHLLLGLLAADKSIFLRYLGDAESSEAQIRDAIVRASTVRPPLSTSVDLPLSNECKHILAYGADEAEKLEHHDIDTDHLLLGILREDTCFAARLLGERGLQLSQARVLLRTVERPVEKRSGIGSGSGAPGILTPHVRFVEAGSLEPVLTHQGLQWIPRIGDTVVIRDRAGADLSYRVQDVVWRLEPDAKVFGRRYIDVDVVIEIRK
jgi:ATP-dependent Clp protease ATP-binding subunit ClpC